MGVVATAVRGRSPSAKRWRVGAVTGVIVAALVASFTLITPPGAVAADTLISQGKPATSSSTENATLPASNAVDGSTTTRWSSAFSDPQWIQIDLGTSYTLGQVVLNWEAAYASGFQLQTSTNGSSWTTIYSTTAGTGGIQTLTVTGSGRYIRLNGTARATPWGYSLFEFQVYGSLPGEPTPTPTGGPIPGGGPLGPNVIVFDPSMSTATIQSRLSAAFSQQETNQFGTQRYQFLFRPGAYNGLNANVGFYTSINGLGRNPTDVQLNSSNVTVDAGWFGGNATQNFWRSVENFSMTPPAGVGYARWAVAQAAPFRRMNVNTHLSLTPTGFGWASGGYIADSRINGQQIAVGCSGARGAAALLLEHRPNLTPDQVKSLLRSTASPMPKADAAGRGAGGINVAAADKAVAPSYHPGLRSDRPGPVRSRPLAESSHVADEDAELTVSRTFSDRGTQPGGPSAAASETRGSAGPGTVAIGPQGAGVVSRGLALRGRAVPGQATPGRVVRGPAVHGRVVRGPVVRGRVMRGRVAAWAGRSWAGQQWS